MIAQKLDDRRAISAPEEKERGDSITVGHNVHRHIAQFGEFLTWQLKHGFTCDEWGDVVTTYEDGGPFYPFQHCRKSSECVKALRDWFEKEPRARDPGQLRRPFWVTLEIDFTRCSEFPKRTADDPLGFSSRQ